MKKNSNTKARTKKSSRIEGMPTREQIAVLQDITTQCHGVGGMLPLVYAATRIAAGNTGELACILGSSMKEHHPDDDGKPSLGRVVQALTEFLRGCGLNQGQAVVALLAAARKLGNDELIESASEYLATSEVLES